MVFSPEEITVVSTMATVILAVLALYFRKHAKKFVQLKELALAFIKAIDDRKIDGVETKDIEKKIRELIS